MIRDLEIEDLRAMVMMALDERLSANEAALTSAMADAHRLFSGMLVGLNARIEKLESESAHRGSHRDRR